MCAWPTLRLTLATFRRALRLLATDPHRAVTLRLGRRTDSEGDEWLGGEMSERAGLRGSRLYVRRSDSPGRSSRSTVAETPPTGAVGTLFVGPDGACWGSIGYPAGALPWRSLALVGTGMHVLPLAAGSLAGEALDVAELAAADSRWSRTVGALGGAKPWRRLIGLRVGVVGCGRTGSLMALALARLGVRRLVLIDPDLVETHNLGEMDAATERDIGVAKVDALSARVLADAPEGWVRVRPLAAAIDTSGARGPAAACDVLVSSVDNDAARLATAILATLYHRVLIDLGTGVFARGQDARVSGADVRLLLPGDGCLLCRGSLTDFRGALDALGSSVAPAPPSVHWSAQRAGSLRSLNQLAVSLALGMLEDLVAERLTSSLWAHVERDSTGRVSIRYPFLSSQRDPACRLCAMAGQGDAGLGFEREGDHDVR